ncbi:MFS transporter [Haloechinothrix salitolerans]|uniref:MFS transporter n=1 Tax=Haloechinothrix salitolerans TaxID=926830 RepID=A0ABW2C6C7_9PSEU
MTVPEVTTPATAAVQRNTIRALVAGQALGGLAVTSGAAVAVLLAEQILGSPALAGLAQTAQVVGAAGGAFVLARLMSARGRRAGLVAGYGIGALGTGLCVLAGVISSFTALLVGTFAIGWATAANSQARYAATDLAEPGGRARALAVVVWATTLGAVAGPNLTGPGAAVARWLGIPEITGIFVLAFVAAVVGTGVLWLFLRPDPLLLAREHAAARGEDTTSRVGLRRVWSVVSARPQALAAIVAIAVSHGVMLSVMVMTPVHMNNGGAALTVIGFVISVHVLGMFAFSPVVGWLTDRLGRAPMLAAGSVLLLASVALSGTAPEGHSVALTVGLFLLGLGWSFSLIGGSALLVDVVPFAERPATQGASDLVMGVFAAVAGAAGGAVVAFWGFAVLNIAAGALSLAVLGAAVVARVPRSGAASPEVQSGS